YERLNQLDRAKEQIDVVLKYHPNSIPAHRLAASVARQEGRLDDALKQLAAMDEKSIPMHWESARAWYEKGQIHDKAGEYEKAINSWQMAKQYYPNDANYKLFVNQANFIIHHPDRVFDSLTSEQLKDWRDSVKSYSKIQRLTVLAGHPRSGTTLLEQALDAHSDATSAEETSIFSATVHGPIFEGQPANIAQSQILENIPKSRLIKYRRGYKTLIDLALEEKSNGRMIIDKNPDLLQLLPTLLRVLPEARILLALRDPRDILISIFSQPLPPNHNSICHLSLDSSSKFVAKRLGLWLKLRDLAPDIACVLKYENLVKDFQGEVTRALDHMELPWDDRCADPAKRAIQRVVQSPTYADVREPVHSKAIGRWKNYQPWIEPHLETLSKVVDSLGYV
ncbi:MAG: tetratricopeptide repeat-containing sulfotransferase family protein, partial [Akkermansiaceae bacterium]